ncbi:hypothetical protein SLS54_009655 [Diplodia seriata]
MPAPLYSNALAVGAAELGFLGAFAALVQRVPRQATFVRGAGVLGLAGLTLVLQEAFAGLSANPHWRAVAAPVSWIQLMSASELLWVSRISAMSAGESVGLLWNLRRVGTKRQAKNTAATTCGGRARFVGRRLCTTLAAYLVIDAMLLAPSPDAALVAAGKDTLVQIRRLSVDDIIFRLVATFSFWLSTALLNLVMSNAVAIACVLTRLSSPKDCPPLYGPIREAYTIRRFWGNFWHQCLRCGLTGHADAIVDAALPAKRSSAVSRVKTTIDQAKMANSSVTENLPLEAGYIFEQSQSVPYLKYITLVAGSILFVRALLNHYGPESKEPKTLAPTIPLVGHLIGMLSKHTGYFDDL